MSVHSSDGDRPQASPESSTGMIGQNEIPCGAMDSMTGSLAARLDGCPSCVINTEVPYGAFHTPAGSLVALYKCTDCGHRWHTSWAPEVAA